MSPWRGKVINNFVVSVGRQQLVGQVPKVEKVETLFEKKRESQRVKIERENKREKEIECRGKEKERKRARENVNEVLIRLLVLSQAVLGSSFDWALVAQ